MSLDFSLVKEVASENYTHNVIEMWVKAGCYDALYNSEGRCAENLVPVLYAAIQDMLKRPAEYKALNPDNGWGDYDGALKFLLRIHEICLLFPSAIVSISK